MHQPRVHLSKTVSEIRDEFSVCELLLVSFTIAASVMVQTKHSYLTFYITGKQMSPPSVDPECNVL